MAVDTNKSVGELVEEYVAIRDFLSIERKKFQELEAGAKSDLEQLECAILDAQRKLGVKSLSTDKYTAFQTPKVFVRVGDWDTFSGWILKTGNMQCVEKRCAKLACLEVEEVEGLDLKDIGLEKTEEISVQVRRK